MVVPVPVVVVVPVPVVMPVIVRVIVVVRVGTPMVGSFSIGSAVIGTTIRVGHYEAMQHSSVCVCSSWSQWSA